MAIARTPSMVHQSGRELIRTGTKEIDPLRDVDVAIQPKLFPDFDMPTGDFIKPELPCPTIAKT
jgi:hypothetical protein